MKFENSITYRKGYLLTLSDPYSVTVMLKITEDGFSNNVVWKNPNINSNGGIVVHGERIYCCGKSNKLYCIDWDTGKEIFSQPMNADIFILGSIENLLYCYDSEDTFTLMKPLDNKFEMQGSFKATKDSNEQFSNNIIDNIINDNLQFVYNNAK